MAQLKLTQGKVALVDDSDFEFLNQWNKKMAINYKFYNLGRHDSIEEALAIRNVFIKEHHGDFARSA